MLDIIGKRRYGYMLSAILVTTGLLFIIATLIPNGNVGLQFSIAYTGGTALEVGFEQGTPEVADVQAVLDELGLEGSEVAITESDDREYVLIRTAALALIEPELAEGSAAAAAAAAASASPGATAAASLAPSAAATEPGPTEPAPTEPAATEPAAAASLAPSVAATEPAATAPVATGVSSAAPSPDSGAAAATTSDGGGGTNLSLPTEGEFGALVAALQDTFGPIDEVRQQNSVGPVVTAELIQQTFLLIAVAALGIMAWVAYRFRDFRMGVTAILALLHDVVIVVGSFAVLGTLTGLQIDALFVTAMLTVIGYSVHDTIVVFDRIRENRGRYLGEPLENIVNFSLVQTLGRSLTTSLTLVLTLVALLLFAGEAIRPFTLALLIGVVAGTYSSIFVATPLFLDWHLISDRRRAEQQAAEPSAA